MSTRDVFDDDEDDLLDKVAKVIAGAIMIAIPLFIFFLILNPLGLGAEVASSQYSGDVADIEEDSGIVWKTTEVEIKTDAEATEPETFCVAPDRTDEILPKLRHAQTNGDRVTVEYERGYVEPIWKCAGTTDGRRITDVTIHDDGGEE